MNTVHDVRRLATRAKDSLLARSRPFRARARLALDGDPRALALRLPSDLVNGVLDWQDRLPFVPKTILDVGANEGNYAAQFASAFRPDIMALVEPIPELCDALRKRTWSCPTRVFCCALGAERGHGKLNVLANMASSSLLDVSPAAAGAFGKPMNTLRVQTTAVSTLDAVADDCGLADLDLLKLDVQGSELDVCRGGKRLLPRTRLVYTEISMFEHYLGQPLAHQVLQSLDAAGFALAGTFDFTFDSAGNPLQCDALFVNTRLRR